jgi:hypothetical protein
MVFKKEKIVNGATIKSIATTVSVTFWIVLKEVDIDSQHS